MKKSHPGFITTSGIVLAVVTALIITGFILAKGGMLFNPGALNAQPGASLQGVRSHAEFTNQCGLCHVPFWSNSRMADRCMVCHSDVGKQLPVPTSMHGTLAQEAPAMTCQTCHGEHLGPEAALTKMNIAPFLHAAVGFSLASHQTKTDGTPFVCEDCHTQTNQKLDRAICSDCHMQMDASFMQGHNQLFGRNCLDCHDGMDRFNKNFDHSGVPFLLTGKHAQVPCGQCHIDSLSLAELKATPQDCNFCHWEKDLHHGRFGSGCSSCHTTSAWLPLGFDHNSSTFQLTGTHTTLTCESCHFNAAFTTTPAGCNACHAVNDRHIGNLGSLCSDCHTTTDWAPVAFDHDTFAFKLTGKHTMLDCEDCHVNGVFKDTPVDCNSCHLAKDFHKGNLGPLCGNCHTTTSWKPAPFDHNSFVFHLTGRHATLFCESCHINGVFDRTSTLCNTCHATDDRHKGNLGVQCGDCHTTADWTPVAFDHNSFAFKLTGKHAALDCESCHTHGVFEGTPNDCHTCHAVKDIHQGDLGLSCGKCHTSKNWTPAPFDHNQYDFKLTGTHITLKCESCHIHAVFGGTPTDCYSCHATDDSHSGGLGNDCSSCHSPSGWTPSTFDHGLTGFALSGAHASLDSAQCHSGSMYTGLSPDCDTCHAGEPGGHDPFWGKYCGSCHNTTKWKAHFTHPGSCDVGINCDYHATLDCTECHAVSYAPATCDKCHNTNTPPAGKQTGQIRLTIRK